MNVKPIEEFEKDLLDRFSEECGRVDENTRREPTAEEMFFIRELAMLNHFVQHAMMGVSNRLDEINQRVQMAIEEVKFPNRGIQ
jgi:hypothetical protein